MYERMYKRITLILTCINAGALALYLLTENVEYSAWTFRLLLLTALAVATGLLVLLRRERTTAFALNLQLTMFSSAVLFLLMQLVYLVVPNLYPLSIRNLLGAEAVAESRKAMVEVLDYSPYAKPKANTIIRVPGDYGPVTDFVYEWITDAKGFKNMPGMAERDRVPIVAVGDSFVEGLGVHTEETWIALLTKAGYPAYSLGVQGYAPTQMLGAFEHYGAPLRPKWVLIGYLDGVYERERHFLKQDVNELPSAIGRLVRADREVKLQYRYVVTAFLVAGKRYASQAAAAYRYEQLYGEDPRFMSESKLKADDHIRLGTMQRYRQEFRNFLLPDSRERLEATREWQSTLKAFLNIRDRASGIGARTAVIMFYNRPFVYFEHATGKKPLHNVNAFVERDLLREFCIKSGIDFIDSWEPFVSATGKISESTPMSDYPYLRYDGHPSPYGHRIIRDHLEDYFRNRDFPAPEPTKPTS